MGEVSMVFHSLVSNDNGAGNLPLRDQGEMALYQVQNQEGMPEFLLQLYGFRT
uniref:Uncharacterized protein n=1 Tax=Nelumbo nucifera TaxID=4432 RepID=A0A822XHC4_NELNU|nr:TPA_asm: hypothetical protein HUJ06_020825 [Nelumbo nucifera]